MPLSSFRPFVSGCNMMYLQNFLCDEEGATAVEYCVVLCFIIMACIAGINAVGGSSNGLWGKNTTRISAYL